MKHFITIAIALSILDLPKDPRHVILCGESDTGKMCMTVETEELETDKKLDDMTDILRKALIKAVNN